MNLKILPALIIISLLVACNKDQNSKEGNQLKRVKYLTTGSLDTFIYDNKNRLVSVRSVNSNTQFDKAIQYDAQGKIARVTYSYLGVDDYASAFIYNANGQIIKKVATPFQGYQYAYDEGFGYDGAGRLIADTTYYQQTSRIQYFITYTYDNNGNIVQTDFRNFIDPQNQGKTLYSFDKNPNPFNTQGSIYYYLTDDNLAYINSNNIIETKPWWSSPVTYQLEYQGNGLPKKITENNPASPFPFPYVTSYEYQ